MLVELQTNELLFVASEVSYQQLVQAVAAVTSEPVDDIFLDFDEFLKQHGIRLEKGSPRLWQKLCFAQFIMRTSSSLFYDVVLYLLTKVDRWDVSNAVVNELGFVPQTVLDKFRQLPAFLVMPECLASRYTAKELCMMLQTLGDPQSYHCDTMDKAEACQHIIQLLKLRVLPDGAVVTTDGTRPELVLKLRDAFNLGTLGLVDNVHSQPPQRVNDVFVLSFAKLNMVVDSIVRWLKTVMLVPASELDGWRQQLILAADDYGQTLSSFMYFPREAGPRLQYLLDMNQVKVWAGKLDKERHHRDFGQYEGMQLPSLAELESRLAPRQAHGPVFDPKTQLVLKHAADHIRTQRYFAQHEQLANVGSLPLAELQQTFTSRLRGKTRATAEHLRRVDSRLASLRDKPWYHERNRQHAVELRSMLDHLDKKLQRVQQTVQQWTTNTG